MVPPLRINFAQKCCKDIFQYGSPSVSIIATAIGGPLPLNFRAANVEIFNPSDQVKTKILHVLSA